MRDGGDGGDGHMLHTHTHTQVRWQLVNAESTSADECGSLVPSPVKGRPPLAEVTRGTGVMDETDVMEEG